MKYEAFKTYLFSVRKYTNHSFYAFFSLIIFCSCANATTNHLEIKNINNIQEDGIIKNGDENLDRYLPLLKGKSVGIVANQTAVIGKTHLVDTLISSGIKVVKLFSPEHGFRGDADAGATIKDGKDTKTGLPIISLYGSNKKPNIEQMKGIDIMVFDIQDVGVRFYTYISTLHYVMEACAENNVPLIVLDRPNPNGYYVDGPILDMQWKSFIGMHPVPVVYGMTIGEYGQMINGEKWLKDSVQCDLTIIPNEHYTHQSKVHLDIPPSPNLRSDVAIDLYPSLCLFEATTVSIGRGTDRPFEIIGHPRFPDNDFQFTPKSSYGAQNPPMKDSICNGVDIAKQKDVLYQGRLNLQYFIQARDWLIDAKTPFLNKSNMLEKLIGNSEFRTQIEAGVTEEDIRKTWNSGLSHFKEIRKKYLIYK